MKDELYDLIYSYAKENHSVDPDFINQFVNIARNYFALEEYISKTNVYAYDSSCTAGYIYSEKEIFVFFENIKSGIDFYEQVFNTLRGSNLFKYLYTTTILLHEIEHANQFKKSKELNDIESEILRASFENVYKYLNSTSIFKNLAIKHINKKKKKYYNLSPLERLANIYSLTNMEQLSLCMNDEKCYDLAIFLKQHNMLKGYIEENPAILNVPTKIYLKNINPKYDYSKIEDLSNDITVDEKLKFGLEVSQEEIGKMYVKNKTLYNKLNK